MYNCFFQHFRTMAELQPSEYYTKQLRHGDSSQRYAERFLNDALNNAGYNLHIICSFIPLALRALVPDGFVQVMQNPARRLRFALCIQEYDDLSKLKRVLGLDWASTC